MTATPKGFMDPEAIDELTLLIGGEDHLPPIPENPEWGYVHRIQFNDGTQRDFPQINNFFREERWLTIFHRYSQDVFCQIPMQNIFMFFPNLRIDTKSRMSEEHIKELKEAHELRDNKPKPEKKDDQEIPF